MLPTIKTRFILVTGDSDSSIPTSILNEEEVNRLINSKYLIVWFSQNLVLSPSVCPKLQHLPIGMDYHTLSEREMVWGPRTSSLMQEKLLMRIAEKAPPLLSRKPIAYTTFHFAIHRGDRSIARSQIPGELVYYEPEHVKRIETWHRQTEYAFVVSPAGEGIDCHRTWEAINLGCIPIVIHGSLDEMFDGLPVLIVRSWRDITKELLDKTVLEYSTKTFCMEKMTLQYWMDKINSYRDQ